MAKTSPTQKSLALMRQRGFTCAIVEKWNPHARIRQDLFGFVDVLAVSSQGTIAVQSTTTGNMSSRIRKIEGRYVPRSQKEEDQMHRVRQGVLACLSAGWIIEVHGFDSKNPKKPANIKIVTVEDLVSLEPEVDPTEELPF